MQRVQIQTYPAKRYKYLNVILVLFVAFLGALFYMVQSTTRISEDPRSLLPFGAFAAVLYLMFSMVRIKQAMLVMLLIAPYSGNILEGLPFHLTPGDAALMTLVAAWMFRSFSHAEIKIKGTPLDRLLFLFIIFTFFSMINSPNLQKGFKEMVQTVEYYIFIFYFTFNNVEEKEDFHLVKIMLTVASLACSINGIMEYFAAGEGSYRVSSFFGHFNAFGAYLAIMIPFIFNIFLSEKNPRTRMFYLAVMFIDTIALMFTFSRGAWIGSIVAIIVTGMLRGMVQFTKIFTAVVVGLVLISFVASEPIVGRAASIARFNDEAATSRFLQYQIARQIIMTKPFGAGLENLPNYVLENRSVHIGDIHNMFLHIGAERGIFTLIVFVLIFIVYVRNSLTYIVRSRDPDLRGVQIACFSAVLSFVVVNLTAYQLVRGVGIYFFTVMALTYAAARMESLDRKSEEGRLFPSSIDAFPSR